MVTVVRVPYPSGPFPVPQQSVKLDLVMKSNQGAQGMIQRRGNRTKAVIPVRVKGKDSAGRSFEDLAHTLDITASGARLGSIRRELNLFDEVTVFYRQRKIQFRVVWTKKMKGTSEFQVGLQATTQDKEAWGMSAQEQMGGSAPQLAASQASGLA